MLMYQKNMFCCTKVVLLIENYRENASKRSNFCSTYSGAQKHERRLVLEMPVLEQRLASF